MEAALLSAVWDYLLLISASGISRNSQQKNVNLTLLFTHSFTMLFIQHLSRMDPVPRTLSRCLQYEAKLACTQPSSECAVGAEEGDPPRLASRNLSRTSQCA